DGQPRLVDQTNRIPAADRIFGVINRAVATPEGIFLSGDRRVFLFRIDGGVRVWRTAGDFSPAWEMDGAVYVARDGRDLLRLYADGRADVVASFDSRDASLLHTYAAARRGADRVLLTRQGPMRWDGAGAVDSLLVPAAANLFRTEFARATLFLDDGRYAFGTVHGAVIVGADGAPQQRFDITSGLPVDTINGFGEDRDGGLWLAMQNGLARLQLDS